MKRCTVTGANGFLGSNVVRALLARGWEVTAAVGRDLGRENLEDLPVEVRELDLLDPGSVRKALDGGTHLVHTAACYAFWLPDPTWAYRVNLEGTRHVLDAARDLGYERVVHTSSGATLVPAFGAVAADETSTIDLRRFVGHYKTSKVMAELEALRFAAEGLPLMIVHPTTVVGRGDRRPTPTGEMVMHFLCRRMKAYVEMAQNIVDVEDVAEGHVLALERGRPGQRYVLGGENLAMSDMLRRLSELTGIPAPRARIPLPVLRGLAEANERIARILRRAPLIPVEAALHARDSRPLRSEKARRELGWAPRPTSEALASAVRWFSERLLQAG